MKEMKALLLLLGLFVVAVLAFLVYDAASKNRPAEAAATPAVEEPAAAAPAPAVEEQPASEAPASAVEEPAAPAESATAAEAAEQPAAAAGDGIRGSDLLASGSEELPVVSAAAPAPGSAERLPRAYENAPPQIPHSIDGLVPITLGNNACLSCHQPGVAENVGATPMSPTHIKMDLFTKSEGKKVPVDPARYNCTQCHVPQADVQPPVANEFQPEFRDPELRNKSDLDKKWNEGTQ